MIQVDVNSIADAGSQEIGGWNLCSSKKLSEPRVLSVRQMLRIILSQMLTKLWR